MRKKLFIRIISVALALTIALPILAACGCGTKKDAIVIMTEDLSGYFNPFYATTSTDQDVVGMTQIGMLSTEYDSSNNNTTLVAGNEYPTVALDYNVEVAKDNSQTVYTFVIKNGLKFSDGHPLTMNDVMFNIYEYLDPVYTGSSTMYSIDIKGLKEYRTGSTSDDEEDRINDNATKLAKNRIQELVDIYEDAGETSGSSNSYSLTEEQMKTAINSWTVTSGYKEAVVGEGKASTYSDEDARKQLVEDYEYVLAQFKKELEQDYIASKENYDTTALPYSEHADKFNNEIFKFFFYEGEITAKYKQNAGRDDKEHIESFENESIASRYDTQEKAINYVYNKNVQYKFNNILSAWGTYNTVLTQFTADAKSIIIQGQNTEYKNISGVVSLGHTTTTESVTFGGKTYNVAHEHNSDGTPKNSNQYDVLQITINGVDPKAIYNFSFTVAPQHYYAAATLNDTPEVVDIANNKFGVKYADSEFQSKVIQSDKNVSVPMGAGVYAATDINNNSNPSSSAFWNSGIVYFKANSNFMFEVKHEKMRMQEVSSTGALDVLKSGNVDYITPQFTKSNAEKLASSEYTKLGIKTLDAWQLGYGYIGINAGKVSNLNIRKAIMAAMNTSLSTQYYSQGTCVTIDWPMSRVSWAYPFEEGSTSSSKANNHDYATWTTEQQAISTIKKYYDEAEAQGCSASDFKITFTIAGASITEHPTYQVFKNAKDLLDKMAKEYNESWDIEIKADSQALTKLSTGSLSVWAAAWGSTIDPDMYQVYHINSTATSTYAWGYREIKANTTKYATEYSIITKLSSVIEDARETLDQTTRKSLYETAMGYVLDLAVELPVYQRKNLYAFNSKTVTGFNEDVNPYSSPLDKIWNLELVSK